MIDVIIPAYNAHKTIEQTLFSIAYQEIVNKVTVYVVNDASNIDYKETINYFKNFMNIKELDLEKNSGPGLARQYGIDNSYSKYIVFIDSDDVFSDPFSLLNLLEEIEKGGYDVVVSQFVEETDNGFISHFNDRVWLHGKIYKREYLEKEKIKFNNSRANEDNGFNQMIFLGDAKIKYVELKTYIWRNNSSSITRKNKKEYDIKGLDGYIYNIKYALNHAISNNYNKVKIGNLAYSFLVSMYYYYLEYNDLIIDLVKDCREIKQIYCDYEISDEDKKNVEDIQSKKYYNKLKEENITIKEFFLLIDKVNKI